MTVIATVKQCPCGAITITCCGEDTVIWYEREGRVTDYADGDACPECGWSLRDKQLPIEESA